MVGNWASLGFVTPGGSAGGDGGVKLGIAGGLKLGIAGGLKLGICGACGGLKLGIGGGLKLGAAGGLKLGATGGLKPLGIGGGLKPLGNGGGLKPLGTSDALGTAVLAAGACGSLDGAGFVSAVVAEADDAGAIGWALAIWPGFAGSDAPEGSPGRCAFVAGVSAVPLVAAGTTRFVAAGGVVAAEGGFFVALSLGALGGD